ncbi:conserved hypothetical protein [uncultured Desulfobacterium sp.]|uniref:Uncharacterized protein n=1 Tax=uncultured Desulfobacterium sp. TaxID=201089 RepID=A0A445MQY7_9BACT|nr:conserved hypothetical protein [uncultured Desulfobacterium sp.]
MDKRLLRNENIRPLWNGSDIQKVISQLAVQATNHYRHFERHHEKTNAKIR